MCVKDGEKNDFLEFSVKKSQMAFSMTQNAQGIDCNKFQLDPSKIGEVRWVIHLWALSV